jgi:hypothetical protein
VSVPGKYRRKLLPLLAVILVFSRMGLSQEITEKDKIVRVSPGSLIQIRDTLSFFITDSLIKSSSKLIPANNGRKDRNLLYFDSLKVKASRKNLTKKLYNLVVVTPQPHEQKKIDLKSDESYQLFSGRKIKNIEFIRLDVFGSNINNIGVANNSDLNNILNRTHVNTRENIIRKNLLFAVGDTISPLKLSDNERILRELPYINDARIIVVPVSDKEADIIVATKDVYSLGANYDFGGIKKGTFFAFEKNIMGIGHELGIKIPFNSNLPNSPGFGIHYSINNILKSFTSTSIEYLTGLGSTSYTASLTRNFVSSETKYAGGIQVQQVLTTTRLDTLSKALPLKYNLQDYWVARSFLINRESVTRLFIGARYINNNVYQKPDISPQSYYSLQKYHLFLMSAAVSIQKYYKTNLIYGYGRTEDIPYGGLVRITAGREFNEFKVRTYIGTDVSAGNSFPKIGYIYVSTSVASFLNGTKREQGLFSTRVNYFTNLLSAGNFKSRNFLSIEYSRGIGRYSDEHLAFPDNNGFTGFRNDSISGTQRLIISLESVLFSPANYHGFRFAFFGFADLGLLSGSDQIIGNGFALLSLGAGLRIRNDNLLFNTLQIRLAFYPNPPLYSRINNLTISGEQLLKPNNFNSGKPALIPFR